MTRQLLTIFFFLFFFFIESYAEGGIPLPRQAVYQPKGINVGLGMGGLSPSGKSCRNMAVWQGRFEYFYTSQVSAGAALKMYGGNIDKKYALMYQRYHVYARYHFPISETFTFYLSPIIGFETTNLSRIRSDDESEDSPDAEDSDTGACSDEYSLDGFSAGFDAGMGWKFAPDWGLMSAFVYDYNVSHVRQLAFSTGVAYDVRHSFDFLRSRFLGTWLSFEFQIHHYLGTGSKAWGKSLILGINISI